MEYCASLSRNNTKDRKNAKPITLVIAMLNFSLVKRWMGVSSKDGGWCFSFKGRNHIRKRPIGLWISLVDKYWSSQEKCIIERSVTMARIELKTVGKVLGVWWASIYLWICHGRLDQRDLHLEVSLSGEWTSVSCSEGVCVRVWGLVAWARFWIRPLVHRIQILMKFCCIRRQYKISVSSSYSLYFIRVAMIACADQFHMNVLCEVLEVKAL